MKTKEQAAIEYVAKVWCEYANDESQHSSETVGEISKKDFINGIEFAEQWIPVEDELPEDDCEEQVLCKQSCGNYRILFARQVKNWVIGYIDTYYAVTHWRPINRK